MKTTVRIMTVVALLLAAGMTFADPLPDQILKFEQKPMIETIVAEIPYYGHDEESTAYNWTTLQGEPGQPPQYPLLYKGNYVADDFADRSSLPVVHVQWWGSYLENDSRFPVDKFLISFEKDVAVDDPENIYPYSHPGDPILNQVVIRGDLSPGSGTFTEELIHSGGPPMNEELYVYNAELAIPFDQEPDTVYWIKIVALMEVEDFNEDGVVNLADLGYAPIWGWHNRDYTIPDPLASTPPLVNPGEYLDGILADGTEVWHFQDDAVANGEYSGVEVTVNNPDDLSDVDVNQLLSEYASQAPDIFPDFVPQNYIPDVDGPPEIGGYSKDLAFALYSPIPEPASMLLIGLGAVCLLASRRR